MKAVDEPTLLMVESDVLVRQPIAGCFSEQFLVAQPGKVHEDPMTEHGWLLVFGDATNVGQSRWPGCQLAYT